MPNYVKIPRQIVYDTSLSDKRIVIFSYLCARRALDDTVAFSTTELCRWSNMKPNYRDGKINQKYYDVLFNLSQRDYFVSYPDFNKLSKEKTNSSKFQIIQLNIEKFDVANGFGIIYFDELQSILNFKEGLKDSGIDLYRMSSSYILLLLSYLRVNMNRDPDKPQCCYRLYKTIASDIGISERYVGRAVEILGALNIINSWECNRTRYVKDDGTIGFYTNFKIFADYRRFIKDTLGNQVIDFNYDSNQEIQKQLESFESQKRIYNQEH